MGKQKNKKNRNQYREEEYDYKPSYDRKASAPADGRDYPKYTSDRRDQNKPRQQKTDDYYSPVAILIRDELIAQIEHFQNQLDSGVALKDACEKLLKLEAYPCDLQGCSNAERYEAYQLERNVFPSKKDPNVLFSPSTIILVIDKDTRMPAFLVKAFMSNTPDGGYKSKIIIYEQDDNGTNYGRTLRWSDGK